MTDTLTSTLQGTQSALRTPSTPEDLLTGASAALKSRADRNRALRNSASY